MKLAWQNIIHDRGRFSVTVLGVSFAVFLMVFQGSLLVGFLRAASRLIDASDSDIWITARGVQAFEFGTTLESRVREMAAGIPGVMETDRVCMAFAVYRTPNGKQQVVALVGADPNVGKHFPVPDVPELAGEISPDAVFYDVSDRDLIAVRALPTEVEINRHRATIERQIEGYGAFLGVPFLFTSYRNAVRYLGFGPDDAMYIVRSETQVPDRVAIRGKQKRDSEECSITLDLALDGGTVTIDFNFSRQCPYRNQVPVAHVVENRVRRYLSG